MNVLRKGRVSLALPFFFPSHSQITPGREMKVQRVNCLIANSADLETINQNIAQSDNNHRCFQERFHQGVN